MIEVKKDSHADLSPVGSILYMVEVKPQYTLYDVYENDTEFVEIWMPIKEDRKNVSSD